MTNSLQRWIDQHYGSKPDNRSLISDMYAALTESKRAIGDHSAPGDCYATGPMTGNSIRDLVQCPACHALACIERIEDRLKREADAC